MKLIAEPNCEVQSTKTPIETIIKESYLANPLNETKRLNITFDNNTAIIPLAATDSKARFLLYFSKALFSSLIENLVRLSFSKTNKF